MPSYFQSIKQWCFVCNLLAWDKKKQSMKSLKDFMCFFNVNKYQLESFYVSK